MSIERTCAIIKPDAVAANRSGDIISLIELNGFKIIKMEKRLLSKEKAQDFYSVHKGKPFFEDLLEYMTSGPVIVMELEKEGAVVDWRSLMGTTDPAQANLGTIRKMFAQNKSINSVHGSDSLENAKIELDLMF